jgi:AAA domain
MTTMTIGFTSPANARASAEHLARGLPLYPEGFHDKTKWSDADRNAHHAQQEVQRQKQQARADVDREKGNRRPPKLTLVDEATLIDATPFVLRDPALIPPRKWIYGRHYIRDFISTTIAPGGKGKSSLTMLEGLIIATNRPLLGVTPHESVNVWCWNGEDPLDELERRIGAVALHYGISQAEIEGRFFLDTGRKTKIIVAHQDKFGAKIAVPTVEAVKATIKRHKIGLFIVDPFVASHRVAENDNPAIEVVADIWAGIADDTGCAIELVQHSRKTNGAEITEEDGRGGSALNAKTRSARVVNGMSKDEAAKAKVENHRLFFQVTNGKASMALPSDEKDWYRMASVELGNGDSVGVVTTWEWPNAFDGVTLTDLRAVQAGIASGRWRESSQSKEWAGIAVAEVLHLNVEDKGDKAKINTMLKTWIKTGMLAVVERDDEKRMKRNFIEVGKPASDLTP